MKTQEEIIQRLKHEKEHGDMFGFSTEPLLDCLTFDNAKPFLKENAKREDWEREAECAGYGRKLKFPLTNEEDLKAAALDYLQFAWGKAEDHRGISAGRSVAKMTSFCWLLGHDELVGRIEREEIGYAMYGCPILKAVSEVLGAPMPDQPHMLRMMQGLPCVEGCDNGCGQG